MVAGRPKTPDVAHTSSTIMSLIAIVATVLMTWVTEDPMGSSAIAAFLVFAAATTFVTPLLALAPGVCVAAVCYAAQGTTGPIAVIAALRLGAVLKEHVVFIAATSVTSGALVSLFTGSDALAMLISFVAFFIALSQFAPRTPLPGPRSLGFFDPSAPRTYIHSSIHDKPTCLLSIVIPAYNEQQRLPPMLQESVAYLEERQRKDSRFAYEVIVVDDGSKDATFTEAVKFTKQLGVEKVRVMKLTRNCGKGAAVREGVLHARGEYVLYCDADGAAPVGEWETLRVQLKERDGMGISIGTRAKVNRTGFRLFLSWGWHFVVQTLCSVGIRDTQCGYKLFTRKAAATIFPHQHLERWCFDVELLHIANVLEIPIAQVLVKWEEVEGSKVSWRSMIHMLLELAQLRMCYRLGLWGPE